MFHKQQKNCQQQKDKRPVQAGFRYCGTRTEPPTRNMDCINCIKIILKMRYEYGLKNDTSILF